MGLNKYTNEFILINGFILLRVITGLKHGNTPRTVCKSNAGHHMNVFIYIFIYMFEMQS